jgi:hypothetical protein
MCRAQELDVTDALTLTPRLVHANLFVAARYEIAVGNREGVVSLGDAQQARRLARMFVENFRTFADGVSPEIPAAAPKTK